MVFSTTSAPTPDHTQTRVGGSKGEPFHILVSQVEPFPDWKWLSSTKQVLASSFNPRRCNFSDGCDEAPTADPAITLYGIYR